MSKNIRTFAIVLVFALSSVSGLSRLDYSDASPWISVPRTIINQDGSVDSGIINVTGSTYQLTTDLEGLHLIEIYASNITFDGCGHTINGSNTEFDMDRGSGTILVKSYGNGISLYNVQNVTIRNMTVLYYSGCSIYLSNCCYCTFLNVTTHTVTIEGGASNAVIDSNIMYGVKGDYIKATPTPAPTPTPTAIMTPTTQTKEQTSIPLPAVVIPIVVVIGVIATTTLFYFKRDRN
jgi:hypothetical protein